MDAERSEKVIDPSSGSNQTRVRAYNERLVLSLIRRHGSLPKSEIARRTGLSAQTASVIMRSLEADGLLLRGEPQRGKVGQPSIPMSLNPDGVFSIGLKIGRRSAELLLVDFIGQQRKALHIQYQYPLFAEILYFAQTGIRKLASSLTDEQCGSIAGIGVAMPFELWSWAEKIGAPEEQMRDWQILDFKQELQALCQYPVFVQNDATAACGAELIFGRGSGLTDFIYLFIGTFVGGGVVLNHALYSGRTGNAGAFGPMPVLLADGVTAPLIDHASILILENRLKQNKADFSVAELRLDQWDALGEPLTDWIGETARHLAVAIVAACSVIDFEAAIIDGDFPADVRQRIVAAIKVAIREIDLRGVVSPEIHPGEVGRIARALGAASLPLSSKYLLDQSVLFK
ncbi:MAG: ROK family transcriptional regulator [Thiolinea sp.]